MNYKIFLPLFLMLFVTACEEPNSSDRMMMGDDQHMGCQEGEVDQDGKCMVAENGQNNVALFDRDFEGEVVVEEVSGGFYAHPAEEGQYPGVVMIHEWWGLNENIEYMAQLLASEGYNVFAVDLYGGEVASESGQAGELAGSVRNNPEEAVLKMREAVEFLRENGSDRIASLGWCFGGQQSLNLSLAEDLDATVIYYGHLVTEEDKLKTVSGPVLGVFGEEDGSISVESVREFETALDNLGVENEIYVYPGVGHAFANPSGSNYAAEETVDAWEKTLRFLEESLKA